MSKSSESAVETVNAAKPQPRSGGGLLLLLLAAVSVFVFYRNGESWLRSLLLYLSRAGWARAMMTGFPPAWLVARRFVAGETVDEAMSAAQELNSRRLLVTLDFLGESVQDAAEANAACEQILYLLDRMHAAGIDANVSLKLSQLGLKIDENLAVNNLRRILTRARQYGRRVRVDMEESAVVDVTLDIYRRLRDGEGFDNVGVVIQSYLFRSEEDVRRLVAEGAWVRLVKGAYKEPADVAYADKGRRGRRVCTAHRADAERRSARQRRLPGDRLPRRQDNRRNPALRPPAQHPAGCLRVSVALRHPPRAPDRTGQPGPSGAHLRALRRGVVSLLYAPPGGTPGQPLVLCEQLLQGIGRTGP
jgi:hypothetical protein